MEKRVSEMKLKDIQPFYIPYDKFDFEINIHKEEVEHNVKCSFRSKGTFREAYSSIFRFFNELVWFYDVLLSDINGGHSEGSHVYLNYSINSDRYLLGFQQKVKDERQHLALAFFREALCNESPYYRFLCLDKILQIPFKKEEQRTHKVPWIEKQLTQLTDQLAVNFRNRKIKTLGNRTLSNWLYQDGRNAIAHAAFGEFIRDPNNYDDWDEIKWANTILKDLARKCIIDQLGVSAE
jgi:hypothetical protein